jgi:hypothetical protein
MTSHPVQLRVDRRSEARRIHVVTRAALLLALGVLGCSSLYWVLYLALPALAALVVMQKGGERALAEDAPRAVRALRWLASAYAYLWLLTDALPVTEGGPVDLRIETGPPPTPASVLSRLFTSLPALLLVAILSIAGGLLWVVGVIWILAFERVPGFVADFLTLTLRFQFRAVAYHLGLVDRYPSLEESTLTPVAPSAP